MGIDREVAEAALAHSRLCVEAAYPRAELFVAMGVELERACRHEAAPPESRKRILRATLVETVASADDPHD